MSNIIQEEKPSLEDEKRESERIENARIEPTGSDRDMWKYNKDYNSMADFIGLNNEDRFDEDIGKKISFIRDVTQEKDEIGAKTKIKQMIRELGIQSQGRDLVDQLYRYARLHHDRQLIDKEIGLYKKEDIKQKELVNPQSKKIKEFKEVVAELNHEKNRLKWKVGQIIRIIKK